MEKNKKGQGRFMKMFSSMTLKTSLSKKLRRIANKVKLTCQLSKILNLLQMEKK